MNFMYYIIICKPGFFPYLFNFTNQCDSMTVRWWVLFQL